jgi:hypothetical protein
MGADLQADKVIERAALREQIRWELVHVKSIEELRKILKQVIEARAKDPPRHPPRA